VFVFSFRCQVVYVELNDAWSGFSKAATPELSRDLPGRQNVIDASGLLAVSEKGNGCGGLVLIVQHVGSQPRCFEASIDSS
jgi:hypothetical protein